MDLSHAMDIIQNRLHFPTQTTCFPVLYLLTTDLNRMGASLSTAKVMGEQTQKNQVEKCAKQEHCQTDSPPIREEARLSFALILIWHDSELSGNQDKTPFFIIFPWQKLNS